MILLPRKSIIKSPLTTVDATLGSELAIWSRWKLWLGCQSCGWSIKGVLIPYYSGKLQKQGGLGCTVSVPQQVIQGLIRFGGCIQAKTLLKVTEQHSCQGLKHWSWACLFETFGVFYLIINCLCLQTVLLDYKEDYCITLVASTLSSHIAIALRMLDKHCLYFGFLTAASLISFA